MPFLGDYVKDDDREVGIQEVARQIARIRLLPSFEEVQRRNVNRGMRITKQEVAMLYEQQARLTTCDQTIDNTHMAVDNVARILAALILQNNTTSIGSQRG